MSAPPDTSSDDDDFQFESAHAGSKRYPVHDCCEFEDADSLKRLLFVPQQDSDDGGSDGEDDSSEGDDDESSSTDDNDSLAAAHAAAIGHSPRPMGRLQGNHRLGATVAAAAGLDPDLKIPENVVAKDGSRSGIANEVSKVADAIITADAAIITTKGRKGTTTEVSPSSNDEEMENPLESTTHGIGSNNSGAKMINDEGHDAIPQPPAERLDQAEAELTGGTASISDGAGAVNTSKNTGASPAEAALDNESSERRPPGQNGQSLKVDVGKHQSKKSKKRKKQKKPSYYCPYDLNERDEDENTPLHVAIHACKLEHVRLLLRAGASPHRKCDGSFPVHTAISMGSLPQHTNFAHDCVALLSGQGADLSMKDDSVHTPLYLAAMMNLPQVVRLVLSNSVGMSTLNARADRSGGRALHAAAKFDWQCYPSVKPLSGKQVPQTDEGREHTSVPRGKSLKNHTSNQSAFAGTATAASSVTEILLATTGVEVDAQTVQGQTALHVACSRGNWSVVRLLLRAGASTMVTDRRGFTPGQLAHKRGMPIPNDLLSVLGGPPSSVVIGPPRDLIVDPDSTTFLICHELCLLHRSCPPIRRDTTTDPPPENVRRLSVLINNHFGILRSREFGKLVWNGEARRASMADVLKVHEYSYVESISQMCSAIPDHPSAFAHLDADTAVSRWSFEAALRAAGSVCEAVDRVVNGDHRNGFCAVRPPGHHAGPRGIVRCANDPDGGSHGFCLLNNVAIGAAYARCMYRNDGIKKIAIVDFDVHHGNGTEEIIRQLVPTMEKAIVRTPFAIGELATHRYRPWLDETDINDVFFASTHGYGSRGLDAVESQQGGWFYPASGKTRTTDAVASPSLVESPNVGDFILSQTWTRMGEEARTNCCKIVNCGLTLPSRDAVPGFQRLELRDSYRRTILPRLREFDPDIIFISAGFDAHKKDTMNFGYVGMVEDDYEWLTEQLVKVANSCCQGRIVSVLEGGYKIHGGVVSPFARSVASHVRALVDGARSRELYDQSDCDWESRFERQILEERERKRQQKQERQHRAMEMVRRQAHDAVEEHDNADDGGEPMRKRRRHHVDYRELYEQMKQEGSAA